MADGSAFCGGWHRERHPFRGRVTSRAAFIWGRVTSRAASLLPWRGALLLYDHFVEKGVIFTSYFHPFLTKRIALLPYEHFFQKGVISPGIFLPFLTKRIALLPYEHFFQKGVIIWIPESPKTLNLLPIDDFAQKGVIFAEKNTPFWKKFLYRSKGGGERICILF
ncbi:MAG: hypothetical protein IKF93_09165 [Lachnospiraceae bacterium]|nr:hypothetical protein [Lachnospiraceae bacterium]